MRSFAFILFSLIFLGLVLPGTSGNSENLSPEEGQKKVEFLYKNLTSAQDFKVRIAAAQGLGKIGDGTVADWMIRAFKKEKNAAVRLATIYAIAQIPDHRTLAPLFGLAQETSISSDERLAIEQTIWNLRKAVAIQAWQNTLMDSKDPSLRSISAWILGIVGNASHESLLIGSLQDNNPQVQNRVLQALGRIGGSNALTACQRMEKTAKNTVIASSSRICQDTIRTRQSGKLPQKYRVRVDLKNDLYGLEANRVTPREYLAYHNINENSEIIDRAASMLRTKSQAEERENKIIQLVTLNDFKDAFFRLDVDLVNAYRLHPSELSRMKRRVRQKVPEINQCYVNGLSKNPKLEGDLRLEFEVMENGRVGRADFRSGSLRDSAVRDCIVDRIREISFGTIPVSSVRIQYAFSFHPPKDQKFDFSE